MHNNTQQFHKGIKHVFVGTTIIQVVLIKEKKGRWTHRNMSTEYAAGADVVPSKITGRGRPPPFFFPFNSTLFFGTKNIPRKRVPDEWIDASMVK
jgi:hypothetical protein